MYLGCTWLFNRFAIISVIEELTALVMVFLFLNEEAAKEYEYVSENIMPEIKQVFLLFFMPCHPSRLVNSWRVSQKSTLDSTPMLQIKSAPPRACKIRLLPYQCWVCLALSRFISSGWRRNNLQRMSRYEGNYLPLSWCPALFVYCFHLMLLGLISEHKTQAVRKFSLYAAVNTLVKCYVKESNAKWHISFQFVYGNVSMRNALSLFTLDKAWRYKGSCCCFQPTHPCLLNYNFPLAPQSSFGSWQVKAHPSIFLSIVQGINRTRFVLWDQLGGFLPWSWSNS